MASIGGMLKYLKHSEIDKTKWDNCVKSAVNPLVYHLSGYLDIIHSEWKALVYDNNEIYKAVMPLLPDSRMGFKLHRKPNLAQQLGLSHPPDFNTDEFLKEALNKLTHDYQLLDYPLNYYNQIDNKTRINSALTFETNTTEILPLNGSYAEIKSAYRRDRKSRLSQAIKNNLNVDSSTNSEIFLKLFSENVASKITGGVNEVTLSKIKGLIQWGLEHEIGLLYIVSDSDKNHLSAGYFTLFANRLTYLFGASSISGKSLHANTFLLDHVIQQNAGTARILDFEGSSVDSIRDFYKGFGSIEESFIRIRNQNLPPIFQALLNTRKKIHQLLNPGN